MIGTELPVALRQLIDARLDNVERALMLKGVDRSDRQQIVSAIEDQILEMLHQSAGDEATREDVLSVLAKLDPPEAYLETSSDDTLSSAPVQRRVERSTTQRVPAPSAEYVPYNVLSIIGFVFSCLSILISVSWWILGLYGLFFFGVAMVATAACTNVALWQFMFNKGNQRGQWMAIVGNCGIPVAALFTWFCFFLLESM